MADSQNDGLGKPIAGRETKIAKPEIAARGGRAAWLKGAAFCAVFLFAYAARRHANHPGATTVGPSTVTEPERKFVGSWTTTHTAGPGVGIVILKTDNRYYTICKRNLIMNCDGEGRWFLRDNSIVWIYDREPGPEDINPIVEFAPDRFVIKEMDGTLTTLARIDAY